MGEMPFPWQPLIVYKPLGMVGHCGALPKSMTEHKGSQPCAGHSHEELKRTTQCCVQMTVFPRRSTAGSENFSHLGYQTILVGTWRRQRKHTSYSAPGPCRAQFLRLKSSLVLSVRPWVVTIPMAPTKFTSRLFERTKKEGLRM